MSFELFIWDDEQWNFTGQKFPTHESATLAGEHSYTEESEARAAFEVRESAEEPNQDSCNSPFVSLTRCNQGGIRELSGKLPRQ